MWRAFFLAMGISLALLGAECLVIEQAQLTRDSSNETAVSLYTPTLTSARVVRPPEWVPWTFMSAGTVVILYSFTIPKRVNG